METEQTSEEIKQMPKLERNQSSSSDVYIPEDYNDDGDDGYLDEEEEFHKPVVGVKYLTSAQLFSRVEQIVKDIVSMGFSYQNALLYLFYFNFDKETLVDRLFDKIEQINKELKLQLWKRHQLERVEKSETNKKYCSICYAQGEKMTSSYCECEFCDNCWRDFFLTSVKGNLAILNCMGCQAKLPQEIIRTLLSSTQLQLYKKAFGNLYVDKKKSIKWCPGLDCGIAVEDENRTEQYITCKCNTEFCFQCDNGYHKPALCKEVKEWKVMIEKDDANIKWIMVNTKICPFCTKAVERSMGCNFMYCDPRASGCGQNFCYVCEQPWEPDHKDHFKCNQFVPDAKKEDSKKREEEILKRYNFYYEKYLAAQNSCKKAKEVFLKVKEWRDEIYNSLNIALQETQFLNEAFQVIIEAKSLLQYSYVFGFYLASDQEKPHPRTQDLFEYFQGEFEKYCDHLAMKLDMDFRAKLLYETIKQAKDSNNLENQQIQARNQFFELQQEIVSYTNASKTKSQQLAEQIESGKVFID